MLRSITAEGHSGQTDKAGAPYVLHPLRVMLSVTTNEERIVAVLHDLVEDCPGWSFERLREEGFSERVLTALASVTKRDGEEDQDFVRRAAAGSPSSAARHQCRTWRWIFRGR
jgi:(p)ppGpp synthase/HD superfamily hydrolase